MLKHCNPLRLSQVKDIARLLHHHITVHKHISGRQKLFQILLKIAFIFKYLRSDRHSYLSNDITISIHNLTVVSIDLIHITMPASQTTSSANASGFGCFQISADESIFSLQFHKHGDRASETCVIDDITGAILVQPIHNSVKEQHTLPCPHRSDNHCRSWVNH